MARTAWQRFREIGYASEAERERHNFNPDALDSHVQAGAKCCGCGNTGTKADNSGTPTGGRHRRH